MAGFKPGKFRISSKTIDSYAIRKFTKSTAASEAIDSPFRIPGDPLLARVQLA